MGKHNQRLPFVYLQTGTVRVNSGINLNTYKSEDPQACAVQTFFTMAYFSAFTIKGNKQYEQILLTTLLGNLREHHISVLRVEPVLFRKDNQN